MIKIEEISPDDYYSNYIRIKYFNLNEKKILWRNFNICFYCQKYNRKSNPDLFKQNAHAVSSYFNSNLYNYDECDVCNNFFSNKFETKLSLFFDPIKSFIFQNHKFKQQDSFYYNKNGDVILHPNFIKSIDQENRIAHITIKQPSISILDIYCCLLKMGLSVFNRNQRREVSKPLKLLSLDLNYQTKLRHLNHYFLFGIHNEYSTEDSIAIYTNKSKLNLPKYFIFIKHHRFYFQLFIPFINDDATFNKLSPTTFQFGSETNFNSIYFVSNFIEKGEINLALKSTNEEKFENYITKNNLRK
ncbi:hypothetical protein EHQ24_16765 [Leptospira noumeaensis]|uniref:HNH endonuclease 5 domain-containing protein n=1 Tax=Leptospira noumeaensis TaxID=2484964 RepID=A0A4R9I088_9LEPT|nr:hypothetical protein [Leptospira noumeaensis]TGK78652.1 hypothetical protein EHQ24_16765 [Leptospira noumeaensis]